MLPFFEHAGSDFFDALLLQRRSALNWHVNVSDSENFALHSTAYVNVVIWPNSNKLSGAKSQRANWVRLASHFVSV